MENTPEMPIRVQHLDEWDEVAANAYFHGALEVSIGGNNNLDANELRTNMEKFFRVIVSTASIEEDAVIISEIAGAPPVPGSIDGRHSTLA